MSLHAALGVSEAVDTPYPGLAVGRAEIRRPQRLDGAQLGGRSRS